jgi:arylsulfatase A
MTIFRTTQPSGGRSTEGQTARDFNPSRRGRALAQNLTDGYKAAGFLRFGAGLCLLMMALALLTAEASVAGTKSPNILFLLCDDLGYGDLACFGSNAIKTPNLDRLAKEGLKLTSYYSPSPVCSPSRAGVMTGRNPNRLCIRDWIPGNSGIYLKPEETTVPELLKTAGYRTAHVGKWHLNSRFNGMEPTPGDHGFDYWISTQNNAAPTHQNPTNFVRMGKRAGPLMGNSSTIIADEALKFIREDSQKPWCVFAWFHSPHEIVATPEEFTKRYPGVDDPTKAIYYGSVSLVDHEVGRLMAALDELKQRENTLVVFTSDNGPETLKRYPNGIHSHGSPGPYRGMKLHVYEGGYRVPAIVRWPAKIRAGRVSDEPVSGLDLLPTFCEAAGTKLPTERPLDGASFMPVFSGGSVKRTTPLYWQYDVAISKPWTLSLREGPWKVVANAEMTQFELYNLKDDPGETRNLAADRPERLRELREKLVRKHGEINSEGSTK